MIVPCRDAERTLSRTLAALSAQRPGVQYEVIVVDDGSRDRSVTIARQAGTEVRVLEQRRLGPGPARNAGARVAKSDVLAFTDADCFPDSGWLAAGLAATGASDLVQGAVRPDPATPMGPFDRSVWVKRETGRYEAANLFIRRELFERLGGFEVWLEPEIGKALAEDVWLGWRARRAGARIAFCPEALVHHAVFRRGPGAFIAERRRLRYFPDIAAKIPEARGLLFFARYFHTPRSAAFDLALLGAGGVLATRSLLPAAAALPYAWLVVRRSGRWGGRAPWAALVEVAADAVGFLSLAYGSIRRRTLVL